jgi:formyl-CoA transferase
MMACYHRDVHGGSGQQIDVSLYEPILTLIGGAVVNLEPHREPPGRFGSRLLGSGSIRNVYRTRDGEFVAISCSTPRHERELVALVSDGQHPETSQAADEAAAQWMGERTCEEILEQLLLRRIPVVPVNDLAVLASDPHVRSRESLLHIDDAEFGRIALPQPAPRLGETPATVRWVNPGLGEHNDAVYGDLLGMSPEAVEGLRSAGVI